MKNLKKHKKKKSWDEELMIFALKLVGGTILFFLTAVGIDIYRFFH